MTRTLARVALSAVLATGVGLALELPAHAATHGAHEATAPAKKNKKKPTLKLKSSEYGKILVTTKGNTLYLYTPDGTDTDSQCVDACADAWPAYAPNRKPKVGKGLDESLAGVGGGDQATYNGHLLYEFSGDSEPGDTNGQDVGGVWYVLDADGEPITS